MCVLFGKGVCVFYLALDLRRIFDGIQFGNFF